MCLTRLVKVTILTPHTLNITPPSHVIPLFYIMGEEVENLKWTELTSTKYNEGYVTVSSNRCVKCELIHYEL